MEDSKYRYEYDKVGNRTKRTDKTTDEVTEYAWDIRDRLTGFKLKNALGVVIKSAQYIYDVYDRRIAKIVDLDGGGSQVATTERFVYGTNQNIALVFDGSGNLTNRYMFGNGIDQIEADEQLATGTTLWALTDHLGSVRDVVDNSGTVQNHIVYDAFGNITSQSNSSVIFRYSYTGREFDAESGLYNYRSRPYDPFNGKFIQEDKIGFAGQDWNLNRYVNNSPANFTYPLGLLLVNPSNQFLPSKKSVPDYKPSVEDLVRFAPDVIKLSAAAAAVSSLIKSAGQIASTANGAAILGLSTVALGIEATLFPQPLGKDTDKTNAGKRNFKQTAIIPVTPTFPTAPRELFIPAPRSGQKRNSNKKRSFDPNTCDKPDEKCPSPVPTFFEDPSLREHYTLVATAIQRDNQPILLQKVGEARNKDNRIYTNRYANRKYGSATDYSRLGLIAQWDEYPYASTVQGGFGATIGAVDVKENNEAGKNLVRFFRNNKIDDGCLFYVSL